MKPALVLSIVLPSALCLAIAACGPIEQESATETRVPAGTGAVSTPATPAPASQTPAATFTPIPGLTDTGYTALDGRPLYAECIQPGAPLPPQIPTPSAEQIFDPTPTPGDPNE